MGTGFPSPRNQEINGRAGVEIPTLGQGSACLSNRLQQSPWVRKRYLGDALGKRTAWWAELPEGTSHSSASALAASVTSCLALPPLTVLSKQSSAAQNKSLKLTCRGQVQVTGGREQEPAGLRSNPKRGDHCGPGTESPTPEASLTNTGCLFAGLQILASSFYSQQRSLDKRQPPYKVGGRD